MPQFTVDDDLAALVEKLAKPKPFEHLTFNNALRRVLEGFLKESPAPEFVELGQLLEESLALQKNSPKKAPSPRADQWVSSVPELAKHKHLTTWKAVCDHLKIKTGGDSARRALKNWVKEHKPNWPTVPSIEGE